ncbi:MAG TPA: SDR family oxidoreductase [Vulgatibacter sp.]|nr:SDR family oxidoreductase [Vulgatibacter sp.]
MATAFVTGAGVRVGRAIALALARAGHDVILHANRSRRPVEEVADEIRSHGREAFVVTADLSDPDEVDRLAEGVAAMHPCLDLVVHNAAIFEASPYEAIDRRSYREMLAINLDAPFFLTQGLLPSLRASASPSVIHVTDIGAERPVPGYAHYSVSKAGLLMLTKALAVELAPEIRVNAVAPGTVAFPEDVGAEQREAILRRIPMGREGTVEDVARAVVFLACDAPYVTGQVIRVDGGRTTPL